MKTTCLILFLLLCAVSRAQKTEQYYDYNWKVCSPEKARYYSLVEKKNDLWVRTDYYLREQFPQMQGSYLDQETKIAHGRFIYYYPNKRLKSAGNFKNDRRDSVWLWFHENGMLSDSSFYKDGILLGTSLGWYEDGMIADSTYMNEDGSGVKVHWFQNGNPSEAGIYSAGVKQHGRWKYYHSNGQLSAMEVYNHGRLVDKQYFDENGTPQDTTNRDREASPISKEEWKKYLQKTAYFPTHLKFTTDGEATVTIRFAVDEQGNVVEPHVLNSLHPDFDKIVYDAIKRAPKWLPAIDHNRKMKTYHTQPITFAQTSE